MYDDILLEADEKMEKALEHLVHSFRGIRTGRASPGLVEDIRVDYYGSPTPLKHAASISVPEPRMIVIKPFDASLVTEVVKAIQKSELGITPQSDGKIIRLGIPPLSEDRRKQLVSLVKEKAEEGRVAMRNIRREANRQNDSAQKDNDLTEDESKRLKGEIDELIKRFEKKIDESVGKKSTEILEI